MTYSSNPPSLGETSTTRIARIAANLAGAIPTFGAIIQTILTEIIPNERIKRIEEYLIYLEERLINCEDEVIEELRTHNGIDIFEEGLWQAARAVGEKRKRRIAKVVCIGLSASDLEKQEAQHFLAILSQLSDPEIIILATYQIQYQVIGLSQKNQAFYKRHQDIIGHFSREIGTHNLERGKAQLKDSRERRLYSLGLLGIRDTQNSIGHHRDAYKLTPTGSRFLEFISLPDD